MVAGKVAVVCGLATWAKVPRIHCVGSARASLSRKSIPINALQAAMEGV